MKTSQIVEQVQQDFAHVYRVATVIVDSGELWDYALDVISNPMKMAFIKEANDLLGVPPTKSFLLYYRRDKDLGEDYVLEDPTIRQALGALWGFVFKSVLGYKAQKKVSVKLLGIQSATKFMEGEEVEFE